jgi:pimeloyl-ACP methyl ester carboxylesterase
MTPATVSGLDVLLLPLSRDGRVADPIALDRLARRLPGVADCFVFCHGWLFDRAEARNEAATFFGHLDAALGDRARASVLRVALHWPSKPFGDETESGAESLWPALSRAIGLSTDDEIDDLLLELCDSEVPLGAEEEAELEALRRRLRSRGISPLSPVHALSFWVMKRRAGQVGQRLAGQCLLPLLTSLGGARPRVHLIGHSFGAKLVTSLVLGGLRVESLVLLLGAFSAFAFAAEIPGIDRPGMYRPVLVERRVSGAIAVLHSAHDRALGTLYPAVTGTGQPGRGAIAAGQHGRKRDVVAASAIGAVGARGVGAPEVDLVDVQTAGIPRWPIVNVNGSRVVSATDPLVGAHRDIHHREIATLILLAAGLLQGGPQGVRPPRTRPLAVA